MLSGFELYSRWVPLTFQVVLFSILSQPKLGGGGQNTGCLSFTRANRSVHG